MRCAANLITKTKIHEHFCNDSGIFHSVQKKQVDFGMSRAALCTAAAVASNVNRNVHCECSHRTQIRLSSLSLCELDSSRLYDSSHQRVFNFVTHVNNSHTEKKEQKQEHEYLKN